jgi:bifunctional DNase/RNase
MSEDMQGESNDFDRPPAFFPYDEDALDERTPEDFGELVEVQVEAVFAAQAGDKIQQFVLLTDGERKLPIVIGPFEAAAITLVLEGQTPDRPMTHDLVRNILERLDTSIERVVIDDLWGNTYYAKIWLQQGDQEMEIDSRPSDAIALAVRFDAPIYVAEGILDRASQ